ncbi:MAG: hypothetical protein IKX21_03215, partial [Deltaproteobacteria bacterium]|nr:hypothetical protein [Deltaproteobacteria bacterium]
MDNNKAFIEVIERKTFKEIIEQMRKAKPDASIREILLSAQMKTTPKSILEFAWTIVYGVIERMRNTKPDVS